MNPDLGNNFLAIFRKNKEALFWIRSSYATHHDQVEDIFQKVLLNIWKALPGFRNEAVVRVRKYKVQDLSLLLRDYLIQYKHYLTKEMTLLNNVVYWYLLPSAVGLLLFFYGIRPDVIKTLQLFSIVLVVFFIIYYLNKKAVKEDIEPLLQKLEESI